MKTIPQAAAARGETGGAGEANKKRPCVKPSFEHERVFAMALACGKVSPTQAQCRFNRKNS